MPGLKRHLPDFAFGENNKVSPDEIDRYEQYQVINPSIDVQWFGTAIGTSTQSPTFGIINSKADYPRNVRYVLGVTSGSTGGGTFTATGKDQFGVTVTETVGLAATANGGTVVGTQIFAQVSSAAGTLATMNAGNGTIQLGMGTAGTTTLFGLPTKIGATTDIKLFRGSFNGVGTQTAGTFVFGGTPSSTGNTTFHAFKAPRDLAAGTVVYDVFFKPSYNSVNDGSAMSSL